MLNIQGAIKLHKSQIQALFKGSEETLEIRLPVAKVSAGVNPLYGDLDRESDTSGTTYGPIKCLWYDALALSLGTSVGLETSVQRMMGQYTNATAFAEIWLADILVNSELPHSTTYLDQAKEVLHGGKIYNVLGYIRTGLPAAAPYICVIALRGEQSYES